MAFATSDDLLKYVPKIFNHGIDDFGDELALAEADVIRQVEIRWFNVEFNNNRTNSTRITFNSDLLTSAQWTRATVYYALYAYILPKLSPFLPEGDSFQQQLNFYKSRYNEEFSAILAVGVQYDYNDNGIVDRSEKYKNSQDRLYR